MTDTTTNHLMQGRSWCPWVLCVVIPGQLWVGYGLHQEVWHSLCRLQEWAGQASESIGPLVLALPEGRGCWKQSWHKLSEQPTASTEHYIYTHTTRFSCCCIIQWAPVYVCIHHNLRCGTCLYLVCHWSNTWNVFMPSSTLVTDSSHLSSEHECIRYYYR